MTTLPRIAFLDSWLRSPQEGSGTAVGISGLAAGLAELGCRVDHVDPGRLGVARMFRPGRLPARLAYNLALVRRFDPTPFDAVVGFDLDGCFLGAGPGRSRGRTEQPAGPRPLHAVALKGVAADERRFETGTSRGRFAVLSALEKRNARRADRVLVTSEYCLERAMTAYGVARDRFRIVPEGIDLASWDRVRAGLRTEPGDRPGGPVLLNVARQYRRKDTRTLIDALPAVIDAVPGTVLRVVGGGPELPRLRARARDLGLCRRGDERVVFVGEVPDDDAIRRELLAADLFCLPSRQEGFGIVLLEAMAAGTPIVATRAGAIPEVAPDGEVAELVQPGRPDDLAAAVVRLLRDPEERRRRAEAGRRRVGGYAWPLVARRALEALGLC